MKMVQINNLASGSRLFMSLIMIYSLMNQLSEGAVQVTPAVHITITVTQETIDGVHLTWQTSSLSQELLQKCSLHYGDLKKATASTKDFLPKDNRLAIKDLEANVSYFALITCQHGKVILPSNRVEFTTKTKKRESEESSTIEENHFESLLIGPRFKKKDNLDIVYHQKVHGAWRNYPFPLPNVINKEKKEETHVIYIKRLDRHEEAIREVPKIQHSRHFSANAPQKDPDEAVLVIMSQRHMDGPRVDPHNSKPSSSIILGVICGVVGFIIINVTVVMVVRQFSLRRDRQRRMIELQLEQHGGFIYNIEDLSNS